MKAKVYMRIAKYGGGRKAPYKVDARVSPNYETLYSGTGAPLPTVHFAVEFDIPDKKLKEAEQVIAEVIIPEEQVTIAAIVNEIDD